MCADCSIHIIFFILQQLYKIDTTIFQFLQMRKQIIVEIYATWSSSQIQFCYVAHALLKSTILYKIVQQKPQTYVKHVTKGTVFNNIVRDTLKSETGKSSSTMDNKYLQIMLNTYFTWKITLCLLLEVDMGRVQIGSYYEIIEGRLSKIR